MTYQSMTTAWCVAILLLAVTGANGLYVLELVQVAHRHGVSPPPVATPNREKMCSPNGASSCTAIAKRGVEQMTAMGAHIRQLYSGDAATFGSATWFQPPYDVSAVSTRSIADPATVQAAAALLVGFTPVRAPLSSRRSSRPHPSVTLCSTWRHSRRPPSQG
ncbi:putative membrane-bound acid phosphatase [Trypanosoma cruzi]|uniref:Putative membrane-bound acid phosphatase n=1 Tax=Trypanosoma cruzi TaxID=5693 RepID=A0A2V2V9K4_TRYCR|nr:putative membrane-bound acid phosphatase [Trypanosoma cruzi]